MLAALLCAALTMSCATSIPQGGRVNPSATDPTIVAAALAFSGIRIPAGVVVLGATHIGGIDALYEVAMSATPAAAQEILDDAGVTQILTTGKQFFMPPMTGFTVQPGPTGP